jgi:hypothetical protein
MVSSIVFGHPIGAMFLTTCQSTTDNFLLLRHGEFVLYEANRYVESNHLSYKRAVCQIIDIADLRDIPEEELGARFCRDNKDTPGTEQFILLRNMPFVEDDIEHHDKVDAMAYPFLAGMREVEFSCELQWMAEKHIKTIAFVFQINQVNECLFACSGIRNTFYSRYQCQHWTPERITLTKDFNPLFSPFGGESYTKRIWNSISSIKEVCWRRMTSSKSQWDGRTKHVHFPGMNQECMQYITYMMKFDNNDTLCEDSMSISKAKKVCHSNLSVSHKKRKYDVSLLRIVEEHELDLVRSILGSTFGIGLTHSAHQP